MVYQTCQRGQHFNWEATIKTANVILDAQRALQRKDTSQGPRTALYLPALGQGPLEQLS